MKKCTKKRVARAKLLFCVINLLLFCFLTSSLPSSLWLLKLPNVIMAETSYQMLEVLSFCEIARGLKIKGFPLKVKSFRNTATHQKLREGVPFTLSPLPPCTYTQIHTPTVVRGLNKSDGSTFNHSYDYRPSWTPVTPITLNIHLDEDACHHEASGSFVGVYA